MHRETQPSSAPLTGSAPTGGRIPGPRGASSQFAFAPKRLRHPFLFAALLTMLAGFLDAAAYSALDHLFVSFMSGNTTHLGIVIASGSLPGTMIAAGVILAFVVGSSIGTLICDASGERALFAIMSTEILLFSIALALTLLGLAQIALGLIAFTMGIQNVLHQSVAGTDIGKGFVTGTLFRLGQSLARLSQSADSCRQAGLYFMSWIIFLGGAAAGTVVLSTYGLATCIAGGGGVLLAMMAAFVAGRL